MQNTSKIDTHAHYLPPEYLTVAKRVFPNGPDGIPAFPTWDVQSALDMMDKTSIAASVISVSSPGVHFGDDAKARALARAVNEAGAAVVRDHPSRFGLFASMPLPDIDGTLEEIAFAFDMLNADGVIMMSNARGTYLGDPLFEPIFKELNRRKALVFMHPTTPYCPTCHGSGLDLPKPALEFMFDSTRTVTSLILSGTLNRYADIRFIVPHAGATLPVLAERIIAIAQVFGAGGALNTRENLFGTLRSLYYDLAGFPLPTLFRALTDIADTDHLLYGSDWPFTPNKVVGQLASALDETDLIDPGLRQKIYHDNALTLLPRFANQDLRSS